MEIEPIRAITPAVRLRAAWALRGGALAAAASLLVYYTTSYSFIGPAWLAAGLILGGTIPAARAFVLRRRQNPFGRLEKELRRVRALMEERLINEEDYQRLKSQALEYYRPVPPPQPRLWPAIFWGMVAGLTLPTLINATIVGFDPILITEGGAAVAITTVLAVGAAQTRLMLSGPAPRLQLPGPENRRLLDK